MDSRGLVVGGPEVLKGMVLSALRPALSAKSLQAVPRCVRSNVADDADDDDDNSNREDEEFGKSHELVLLVRTDLKMKKGEIASQVGHATASAYKSACRCRP